MLQAVKGKCKMHVDYIIGFCLARDLESEVQCNGVGVIFSSKLTVKKHQ
jgi:hypothetical protein